MSKTARGQYLAQRSQKSFSLLLAGKPLNNAGAREALAMLRQKRSVPFTPICAFGFVLDEAGPQTMAAPVGGPEPLTPTGVGDFELITEL